MDRENDILKWFNGEISTEDIKNLYPDEDFSGLEKAAFYAKQMEAPRVDAEKALAEFKKKSFTKENPKVIALNYKAFLKIAAVLIIMLASSYLLFFNNDKTFSTAIAQTETLNLPDDSEVILNAKSSVSFNKKSWKQNRTVNLSGEAFFKVTKGEKFTVKTEVGSVQVLGTQFNVKDRTNFFEVMCYEGSVEVIYNKTKTILTLGKTIRIVNGEQVLVNDFNAKNPTWINNESTFDKVPLWRVFEELEVQYGVTITISAENLDTSELFSGSFTHTDKNTALQSVTIPLRLEYKIDGDKVEFFNNESN